MVRDYEVLSALFEFPEADYISNCDQVLSYFEENNPAIAKILSPFVKEIKTDNLNIQELYIRTFDVQSITTLDIGYVLFGDDYKRGELLANLNKELEEHKINNSGNELADTLSNVLQLMSAWNDEELRVEFAGMILFPALLKMKNEFDPNRIKQQNSYYKKTFKTLLDAPEEMRLIYRHCLEAVITLLQNDFPQIEVINNNTEDNDFLVSIKAETEIA